MSGLPAPASLDRNNNEYIPIAEARIYSASYKSESTNVKNKEWKHNVARIKFY